MSLLYNKNAGDGVPLDLIRDLIAQHGHELVCAVEKHTESSDCSKASRKSSWRREVTARSRLAARMLAHRGIPLAILPLGTANNIARSVGIPDSMDDIIAGWETARRVPLDLGVADGVWGRRYFVEAVGGGLISSAIADMDKRFDGDELPTGSKLAGAIRTIGEVLSRLQPVEWTIVADGARMTGEFLLVEVLNIRSIGPNLVLSPEANPSDGLFRACHGRRGPSRRARALLARPARRARPPALADVAARAARDARGRN